MHHNWHQTLPQSHPTVHDVVHDPHNITLCHRNSNIVLRHGLIGGGYRSRLVSMAGSFKGIAVVGVQPQIGKAESPHASTLLATDPDVNSPGKQSWYMQAGASPACCRRKRNYCLCRPCPRGIPGFWECWPCQNPQDPSLTQRNCLTSRLGTQSNQADHHGTSGSLACSSPNPHLHSQCNAYMGLKANSRQ